MFTLQMFESSKCSTCFVVLNGFVTNKMGFWKFKSLSVCWFAFDNRDGKKDSDNVMWVKTDSTQPTGLVTIGGTYLTDTSGGSVDTLR